MKTSKLITILLALVILLSACKLPAPPDTGQLEGDPKAVFTAAAQTADIRLAQAALTVAPTNTRLPTVPPTTTPTLGVPRRVITATVEGPITIPPSDADRAEFVTDLTVPDGTIFKPKETFEKKWRLRNAGTTTWTPDYQITYAGGHPMGVSASMPLPKPVAPGGVVDISLELEAPIEQGTYEGYWALMNPQGQLFGVGANANEPIWLRIEVVGLLPTDTPTPSATPLAITNVRLHIDNHSYTGACPHTFVFTAEIIMSKPSTVTYNLLAENDAGVDMKLPLPSTINVEEGTHSTVFELTLSQSMTGWLQIHITAPEDIRSKRVEFELTCQ